MAMVVVGLLLTVWVLALAVGVVGMLAESDRVAAGGMGVWGVVTVILLMLFIWGLVLKSGTPSVVAGHCYEAVSHGSYVPITYSTGKSVIIVPTYIEGIDLIERPC